MKKLAKFSLDGDGLRYVQSRLTDEKGFCKLALDEICRAGEVFTVLPSDVPARAILDFDTGGYAQLGLTQDWLLSRLKKLTEKNPYGALVLQDVWMHPADKIQHGDAVAIFHDDEVYYALFREDFYKEGFLATVAKLKSYQFIAFYCSNALPILKNSARSLSDSAFQETAQSIVEIYVGAYDQDGIVVWTSEKNERFD